MPDAVTKMSAPIDAPLFRFKEERPKLVAEVSRRTYQQLLFDSRIARDTGVEYLLNDAAYQELERLRVETGPEEEVRPYGWWMDMSKKLGGMSEQRKRALLRELVDTYSDDIAGQFNPQVYKMTTGALPVGLNVLFKAQDLTDVPADVRQALSRLQGLRDLSERVVVEGDLDRLRALARRGTLIVVPTHSSNMDSILIGWALHHVGLPPVTYGAGKNLFTNPLTSFFMHNLGAYKVDRRLRHDIYKGVLKTYSQVLLEHGYHSLFFPGGTRCRANVVESRLKLGLLGTSIGAYTHNLIHRGEDRRIFICPVTINYNLVLEAESLIKEHLQRAGGARYFREHRDEFDQLGTIVRFVFSSMSMDSTTVLRFGQPLDPFGNRVEADGQSYDDRGRHVEPSTYVQRCDTGEVVADEDRDREYTRHCGARIGEAFARSTVLMPTQIVSYALFTLLQRRFPDWDIYRLLRFGSGEVIGWPALREEFAGLVRQLRVLADEGKLHLAPMLRGGQQEQTLQSGLEMLRMYHVPPTVELQPDGIMLNRLNLLYFYSNRVRTFEGELSRR